MWLKGIDFFTDAGCSCPVTIPIRLVSWHRRRWCNTLRWVDSVYTLCVKILEASRLLMISISIWSRVEEDDAFAAGEVNDRRTPSGWDIDLGRTFSFNTPTAARRKAIVRLERPVRHQDTHYRECIERVIGFLTDALPRRTPPFSTSLRPQRWPDKWALCKQVLFHNARRRFIFFSPLPRHLLLPVHSGWLLNLEPAK